MPTDQPMQSHIQAAFGEARVALNDLIQNQTALAAIESAARQLVGTFEGGGRVYTAEMVAP
jgi:hypothetical protein